MKKVHEDFYKTLVIITIIFFLAFCCSGCTSTPTVVGVDTTDFDKLQSDYSELEKRYTQLESDYQSIIEGQKRFTELYAETEASIGASIKRLSDIKGTMDDRLSQLLEYNKLIGKILSGGEYPEHGFNPPGIERKE
jgi:hypothetical protein